MAKRDPKVMSVVVVTLDVDPIGELAQRIDQAMSTVGHLKRALTRDGLHRLDQMRRSRQWRAACALPAGLDSLGNITDEDARKRRNTALNDCRQRFGLTEYAFKDKILELRRESGWICDHVPSSSALVHAAEVFEAFAKHMFNGAGRPKWKPPHTNTTLLGNPRDRGRGPATDEEIEQAKAKNKQPPKERKGGWCGLSVRGSYEDGLFVHLHPSRDKARNLSIPVNSRHDDRESYYLDDPDSWVQAQIVRRRVKTTTIYELHLVCAKPVWRKPGTYDAVPQASVGVDLGVATLAAVGVAEDGTLTGAMLVRPSADELEHDKLSRKRQRCQHRAQERSRRANNPDAYGPDKFGRAGRGSLKPGARLVKSRKYKTRQAKMADDSRKRTETKANSANRLAREIVQTCGSNIVTEDVRLRAWQMTWGRSMLRFAPGDLMDRLIREAELAGGGVTKVPCKLKLTQTCHCGAIQPKTLSERVHRCTVCGFGYGPNGELLAGVNRDLHSGYLAAFVMAVLTAVVPVGKKFGGTKADKKTRGTKSRRSSSTPSTSTTMILDVPRASSAWAGAEALLTATSTHPTPRGIGGPNRQSGGSMCDCLHVGSTDKTGSQGSVSYLAMVEISDLGYGGIDLVGSDAACAMTCTPADVDHEKTHAGIGSSPHRSNEPARDGHVHPRRSSERTMRAGSLRLDG